MEKVIFLESTDVTLYSIGEAEWFNSRYNRKRKTKGCKDKNGYRKIVIKGTPFYLHRLIAEAFLPNPDNLPEVDHINTKRDDNRVENLRWCTCKENQNNPMSLKNKSEAQKGKVFSEEAKKRISEALKGNKNGSKPVIGTNLLTGEVRDFSSAAEAGRVLGFDKDQLTKCCRGERKSARGWHFEYK